jgi:hypothetical protein
VYAAKLVRDIPEPPGIKGRMPRSGKMVLYAAPSSWNTFKTFPYALSTDFELKLVLTFNRFGFHWF